MLYFDNASTTQISTKSLGAYIKASEQFFNPSALYQQANTSKTMIEDVRKYFLHYFNAPTNSTAIFTGSATEANNSVLNSCITRKDKKYIFSAGEHSSIYEPAKKYKEQGYNVVFIPLKQDGTINQEELYKQIDKDTMLVSIIHLSNETGAINDIKTITNTIKQINPQTMVHSDGTQAVGKLKIDFKALGIDYYTMSAHKINGPKGVGLLYIKAPNKFKPFLIGGGQEMNYRSSTENLPGIMAYRQALEDLTIHDYSQYKQAILKNLTINDYKLVSNDKCADNIISICFKAVRGETILHMLEDKGYLVGTGSACNSKAGFNRVLSGIVQKEYLGGAIRISFDSSVTIDDCMNLGKELSVAVGEYRKRTNR